MIDNLTDRLELTEEEAFALLTLCIMSESKMDAESERAFQKLAEFCKKHKSSKSNHTGPVGCELITEAG